ncbi:MAG: PSD1 and planctomycete cytochrome C domain-containing protein [Verrucomicrobiales bacterium]|nr:PSD1 and planctomycete cytochrome C domain-containing protein [Verrucomicrobiales bacterium]
MRNICIAILFLLPCVCVAEKLDFSRDVRPIFSENCFHCHGFDAKARKADLRMDDETSAKRFITPGDADSSELMYRLQTDDPDELMPPAKSHRALSQKQIDTVKRWINEGAPWGGHWAFESFVGVEHDFQGRNPVDVFVERKLKELNISPNKTAEKHTLIRRVSLDITGLPPTPEEVDMFVKDASPGAWERTVDRLLASPHFGERMAWDWLNAARYADTNGYQGDRERTMWPWRDWVVDAYNKNLPFDQFTIWQLAGDLLENPTEEQILATAFNRNHMINGEGGRIAEENRVDYVFDMTETMGTVWLGLTLNCCRCHDHKFDPVTQKDYYSFTAFFNQTPVTGAGGDPQMKPVLAVATTDQKQRETELSNNYKKALDDQSAYARKIAPLQKEWEKNYSSETKWTVLEPISVKATKTTLTVLADQSVLAGGENPDRETHTVEYQPATESITAFKLEVLQHESFTNSGKGLSRSDSGNFVLSEFEVTAAGKPVKIASAVASFEQGGLTINKTFDGNANSGWAVLQQGKVDRPHEGVFFPDYPVKGPLRITLRHDSVHKQHFIGRFRISVTDDPAPKAGKSGQAFRDALKTPSEKRSKEQNALIGKTFRLSEPVYRKLQATTRRAKNALDTYKKSIPKVMVMEDMINPRKNFILNQGLYDSPQDEITAAVPSFLPPLEPNKSANRLALANWLVSSDHPLTARVTVNRIWQMIFGTGLVKTVEDFGVQSEYPVYPGLLDWLASEFIESGWDVKHLLKTIYTSETYRRSSVIHSPSFYESDPQNRYLARGARFRLPSWMIRDQALAVSGLLNPETGGASFNGYQPPGIWEEATFGKKKYQQATGDDLYRRSLYVFWRRIVGPTMFFASSKRQICEVKIPKTNTPMHALSTLNDVTYVEAARHLAERALLSASIDIDRYHFVSERLLARHPSSEELSIWTRAHHRGRDYFQSNPAAASSLLDMGDSKRDESIPAVEHAALTNLCLMLLNLDETLNKE